MFGLRGIGRGRIKIELRFFFWLRELWGFYKKEKEKKNELGGGVVLKG